MNNYDVLIIGAGPGGYVAAIRAAQLGLKVALIEKNNLGGICLNWGCIPTKSLLHSAELYHMARHSEEFGVKAKEVSFDLQAIINRSRSSVEKLTSGIAHLLQQNKVSVIYGRGKLLGRGMVQVSEKQQLRTLEAKHIIIATGSKARVLPNLQPDGINIWTYREAMIPEVMPKSVLVMGSGAIGIEFASFYNMLGAEVTVLEMCDGILRTEDREIAALAHKAFISRGIDILVNSTVESHQIRPNHIEVKVQTKNGSKEIVVEKIISAIGVIPNVDNIGLENTKVLVENGFIKTDAYLKTGEPGVYAIGDVTSPPWLAHKASHEAIICVEKIAGLHPKPMLPDNVPGCIYSYPQIASIGMTEEKAIEKNISIKIGRFPLSASGKALVMGETNGMVKTIFDSNTGELLGAHMIGSEVSEMIHSFALAKEMEATEEDFMHTIFPHPTISESIQESVLSGYDRGIHLYKKPS